MSLFLLVRGRTRAFSPFSLLIHPSRLFRKRAGSVRFSRLESSLLLGQLPVRPYLPSVILKTPVWDSYSRFYLFSITLWPVLL